MEENYEVTVHITHKYRAYKNGKSLEEQAKGAEEFWDDIIKKTVDLRASELIIHAIVIDPEDEEAHLSWEELL